MGTALKKYFFALIALIVLAIPISTTKTVIAEDSYLTYEELRIYEEKRQEAEWSAQLVAYSQTLVGKRTGQCVTALRKYFGESKADVQGLAKNTKPNSKDPKVGSVIILKISWAGHVGKVIRVDGDLITYWDSNGQWAERGAIRTIIKGDRRIVGFRITK